MIFAVAVAVAVAAAAAAAAGGGGDAFVADAAKAAGGRRSGLVGGHIIQLSLCLAFKMSFLAESSTKQTPKMQCVELAERLSWCHSFSSSNRNRNRNQRGWFRIVD